MQGTSLYGSLSNPRGVLSPGASAHFGARRAAPTPPKPASPALPPAPAPAPAPVEQAPVSPSLHKHRDLAVLESRAPLLPIAQDAKQLPLGTGLQGGEQASLRAHLEFQHRRQQDASTRSTAKQQHTTAQREAVCTEALAFFEAGAAARSALPATEAAQLTTAFLAAQQAALLRTRAWGAAWGTTVASITSQLERRSAALSSLLDALFAQSLVVPAFDGGATPAPPAALATVQGLVATIAAIDDEIKAFNPVSMELKGAIEAALASCSSHSASTVALTNAFLALASSNSGSNGTGTAAVGALGLYVKEMQRLNDGEIASVSAIQKATHVLSGWWRGGIVAGAVCAEGPHVLTAVRRAAYAVGRQIEALHPTLIESSRVKARSAAGGRGRSAGAAAATPAAAAVDPATQALWPVYAGFSKGGKSGSSPPRSPPRTTITGGGGGTTVLLGASAAASGATLKNLRKRPALAAVSPLMYEAAASANVSLPSPWLAPTDAAAVAEAAEHAGPSSSPAREAVSAAGKFGDVVALARLRRRGSWSGTSSNLPEEPPSAAASSPASSKGSAAAAASAAAARQRAVGNVQGLLTLARVVVAFATAHAAKTLEAWKAWSGAWDAAFVVDGLTSGLSHDAAVAALQGPALMTVAGLPTLVEFTAARAASAGGDPASVTASAVGSLLTPKALAARLKASQAHMASAAATLSSVTAAASVAREVEVTQALAGGAARPCVALLLHGYLSAAEPDALLTAAPASLLAPTPCPPVMPPTALGRHLPLHAVRRLGSVDEEVKLSKLAEVEGTLLHGWLPRGSEAGEALWGTHADDEEDEADDGAEEFLGERLENLEVELIELPGGHSLAEQREEEVEDYEHTQERYRVHKHKIAHGLAHALLPHFRHHNRHNRHHHHDGLVGAEHASTAVLARPAPAVSPSRSPRPVGGRLPEGAIMLAATKAPGTAPAPADAGADTARTMEERRALHVKLRKELAAARKDRSVVSAGVEAMRRAVIELNTSGSVGDGSAASESLPASKAGYLHSTPPLQEMSSLLSTGTDPSHVFVNTLFSSALPGMQTEPTPRPGKRGAATAALAPPRPSPASLLAGLLCGCGRCAQALSRVTEAGENVTLSHGHLAAGVSRDLQEALVGPPTSGFSASPGPFSSTLAFAGTALPGTAPRMVSDPDGHLLSASGNGTRVDVGPGALVSVGSTGTIVPLVALPPALRPLAARAAGQSLRLEATRQAMLTKPAVCGLARLHLGEWGWAAPAAAVPGAAAPATPPPLPVFKSLVAALLVLGRVVPALTPQGAPALKLVPRTGQATATPWYSSVTAVSATFDSLAGISALAVPAVPPQWTAKYMAPEDAEAHVSGNASNVTGPLTTSEQGTVCLATALVGGTASITGDPGSPEEVLAGAVAAAGARTPAWRTVCAAFDEATVLELLAHDPLLHGRLEALLVQAAAAMLAGSVPGRRNATAIPLPLFRSPRGDDAKFFRVAGAAPLGFSFDAPGLSELEASLLVKRRGVGAAIGPWEAAQINAPLMGKSPRSTAAPTRKGLKQAMSTASPAVLVVRSTASRSPSPAASPAAGGVVPSGRQYRSVSTFALDDAAFSGQSEATAGVLGGPKPSRGIVALVPAMSSPALRGEGGVGPMSRARTSSLVSIGPAAPDTPSLEAEGGSLGSPVLASSGAAAAPPLRAPTIDDYDTPENAPLYIHSIPSRVDALKPLVALVNIAKTRPALTSAQPIHVDTIAAWASDLALPTLGFLSPVAAALFAWAANATATRLHATELARQLSKAAFGVVLEPVTMVAEPLPAGARGTPARAASRGAGSRGGEDTAASPPPVMPPLASAPSMRSPVVIRRLPSTAQVLSGGDGSSSAGVRVRLGVTDTPAAAAGAAPVNPGEAGEDAADEAFMSSLPLIAGGLGDVSVNMARPEHVLYSPVDPRRLPHMNPERQPTARLLANNLEEIDVGAYREQQELDTKMRAAIAAKGLTPEEIAARAARRGGTTLLDEDMGLPYADDEDEDDLRAAAKVAARKHAEWKAAQKAARKGDKGAAGGASGAAAGKGSSESVVSGEGGDGESMWSAPPLQAVKEYTETHYEDMEAGDGDIVFCPDGSATLVLRKAAASGAAAGTPAAP